MRIQRVFPFVLALQILVWEGPAGATDFPNDPGWEWLAPPASVSPEMAASRDGILMITSTEAAGAFVTTVGWAPEPGTSYRAVAFDNLKNRYAPDRTMGPGNETMSMMRCVWLPESLGGANIAYVGFEELTPSGWPLASREAVKRAQDRGIEVISYPEVNKAYPFDVTGIDGKPIRSEDLKGNVVVVDCWATWCTPCMKNIPHIQTLEGPCADGNVEIVGINFDSDREKLDKALAEHNIDWRTFHVPAELEVRDLWFEASSIRMLPRYLVIDQAGIVKLDTRDADEVERTVRLLCGTDER